MCIYWHRSLFDEGTVLVDKRSFHWPRLFLSNNTPHGCLWVVYCCFSSRNQAVVRMVVLSTSESFIEFYVRQLNAFSVFTFPVSPPWKDNLFFLVLHLYWSAKFIASHQDIQAMKSLKQAFVEYENDHTLTCWSWNKTCDRGSLECQEKCSRCIAIWIICA